jgi:ABC-2 type transport system permease protein
MLQQLLAIARNTFTESIRQPIFVVLVLIGLLAMAINPMLASYTMDNDNHLLADMGLSTLALIGLLLAAFTATGVITSELENRTVLTVVSKPVTRPLFVLGKFLGVLAALCVAYWILALAFLMTVRHGVMQTARDPFDIPVLAFGFGALGAALGLAALGNYLYRWVFTSSFIALLLVLSTLAYLLVLVVSPEGGFQPIYAEFLPDDDPYSRKLALPQVMLAIVLVFQSVVILTAAAIAASTRLKQVMTLVVCVGLFIAGLMNNSILGQWAREHSLETMQGIGRMFVAVVTHGLHKLLPDLQLLWVADALKQQHAIPLDFVVTVTGYSLLYAAALLLLAVGLFQHREVG